VGSRSLRSAGGAFRYLANSSSPQAGGARRYLPAVSEPSRPSEDAQVARELEAIKARVALLADAKGRDVAQELVGIRDTLRRLAEDNEEIRERLQIPRVDDLPQSD
jgi:hypothetical protein